MQISPRERESKIYCIVSERWNKFMRYCSCWMSTVHAPCQQHMFCALMFCLIVSSLINIFFFLIFYEWLSSVEVCAYVYKYKFWKSLSFFLDFFWPFWLCQLWLWQSVELENSPLWTVCQSCLWVHDQGCTDTPQNNWDITGTFTQCHLYFHWISWVGVVTWGWWGKKKKKGQEEERVVGRNKDRCRW